MEKSQDKLSLTQMVADLEEDAALALVHQRIENGEDPLTIINEANEGMLEVGLRYERGEYFVAGLIMSGEIFREVVDLVQPVLEKQENQVSHGRVMVGTVHGDIHDLGKNMFGLLLSCHGFEVIDLGVDVHPEVFAEKAIEIKPDVIGLSGLITASFDMMKDTIRTLRKQSEKHNLSFPVIIGGGSVDAKVKEYVGADFWMPDAMAGVRFCEKLLLEEE
jgi:methylmalonyl-CoA mutase cobalamin-binding domain/chain